MKVLESSIIYENPLPQLRSRQSYFPNMCERKDGTLVAVHVVGQAFESVDAASCISFSTDKGKTWSAPSPMFDKSNYPCDVTDYTKITALDDGRLAAIGYTYYRRDPDQPIGNPETGGALDNFVFYAISEDGGNTWTDMQEISCTWAPPIEASAQILVLKDGSWITPITCMVHWNGTVDGPPCGRALRSEDEGKTWNDDSICMEFKGRPITCYEQRMCQLESGAVINIGWNEDLTTGERFNNHYTVSYDNGKTWSEPVTTGIQGQASSVCAIGGEKLLALHAVRRDTERPGVYAYIVDFSEKTWKIVDEALVWEPASPMQKDAKMAEIFSFLKFGQPSAILLSDGDVMMTHWFAQEGQYKTAATRIQL